MARRSVGEINAGSMADIAFLLLIFFLVTTTMEVDAGISRQLPLKLDTEVPPQPPIHDRNILVIMANSNDQLLVENQFMELEDMEEAVYEFYLDNRSGQDRNNNMPMYFPVTKQICMDKLAQIQAALNNSPDDILLQRDKSKWEKKLAMLDVIPESSYMEIHNSAIIQLKNQANTTYGLYIEIQNVLKRVVNDLRQETCEKYNWPDYMTLDETNPDDAEKIEALRILVPERIIEARIER